jgi:UDP-2,3-diacylglucosamine pyrophosphatase LpxH
MYYSFDINNVHIISLNSEVLFPPKTEKADAQKLLTWLKEDLRACDKPWRIVYMHRPLYCSKEAGTDCKEDLETTRDAFEELFNEFKVDLVITGHRHNYERYTNI